MAGTQRGWLTLRGAARYVGVDTSRISRAVHSGALPAYRAGRSFLISTEDIDAWVRTFPRVGEGTGCSIS